MKSADIKIWFALRDARDLTAYEYTLMSVVASRGTMFTSAERAQADMKMSRTQYYRTRKRLIDRGLLRATEQLGGTTEYEVIPEAILALVPQQQKGRATRETGSVVRGGQGLSPSAPAGIPERNRGPARWETGMSPSEHHKNADKKTTKITEKFTRKNNTEDNRATEEQWDTGLSSLEELTIRAEVMAAERDGRIATRSVRGKHGEREQLYSYGEHTDLRYDDFVQTVMSDPALRRSLVEKDF